MQCRYLFRSLTYFQVMHYCVLYGPLCHRAELKKTFVQLLKKLPTCFWNTNLHYHVHHSQLSDPVLSQFNPLYAHNLIPYPRSILHASSHFLSGFHRCSFHSNIPTTIQLTFLIVTVCVMYPFPSPMPKLDLDNNI
jgi:hypothetical protein